ncbi:MAG: hypothetical protein L0Z07_09990 [Planctomycetes bacterium]|nr:hypothetical protein [Planctomycetota bacterium]
MLWYIAFIAILNLLLGYALASYMGVSRRRIVRIVADAPLLTEKKQREESGSSPATTPAKVTTSEPVETQHVETESPVDSQPSEAAWEAETADELSSEENPLSELVSAAVAE